MSVRLESGPLTASKVLTFDNPPANVLTLELIDTAAEAIRGLASDTTFLLVRSTGENFSAGVDVAAHEPESAPTMLESFHGLLWALLETPAIPIAVVQGAALGGGCELATVCDLVVASADARFGQPEITVGCFPPVAVALLPERLGEQRAADMVYSGRPVLAAEAHRAGLVSRLASEGGLDRELGRLLDELGRQSRSVLRATRSALIGTRRERWKERIRESERIYLERLVRLRDAREGVEAFAERRPPRWRHD